MWTLIARVMDVALAMDRLPSSRADNPISAAPAAPSKPPVPRPAISPDLEHEVTTNPKQALKDVLHLMEHDPDAATPQAVARKQSIEKILAKVQNNEPLGLNELATIKNVVKELVQQFHNDTKIMGTLMELNQQEGHIDPQAELQDLQTIKEGIKNGDPGSREALQEMVKKHGLVPSSETHQHLTPDQCEQTDLGHLESLLHHSEKLHKLHDESQDIMRDQMVVHTAGPEQLQALCDKYHVKVGDGVPEDAVRLLLKEKIQERNVGNLVEAEKLSLGVQGEDWYKQLHDDGKASMESMMDKISDTFKHTGKGLGHSDKDLNNMLKAAKRGENPYVGLAKADAPEKAPKGGDGGGAPRPAPMGGGGIGGLGLSSSVGSTYPSVMVSHSQGTTFMSSVHVVSPSPSHIEQNEQAPESSHLEEVMQKDQMIEGQQQKRAQDKVVEHDQAKKEDVESMADVEADKRQKDANLRPKDLAELAHEQLLKGNPEPLG